MATETNLVYSIHILYWQEKIFYKVNMHALHSCLGRTPTHWDKLWDSRL